ncbi:hypothetical protein GCM10010335_30840 [Streptomyces galbus]|nr:hypothetical protein GCM10010335_30840 [Streptomyces galbus]
MDPPRGWCLCPLHARRAGRINGAQWLAHAPPGTRPPPGFPPASRLSSHGEGAAGYASAWISGW